MKDTGHLIEIFSSYQGEGIYAGVRQIFIRLAGCHMRCHYCDTPESWTFQKTMQIESPPEGMRFETRSNPVSIDDILNVVNGYRQKLSYHSISLTGGEPLLQAEFLKALAAALKPLNLPLYLETSGTLSDRLRQVIDDVDIVALDIKLPSTPGVRMEWEDVAECLRLCRGKLALAKIVVTDSSADNEIARAVELVRQTNPTLPLILQPVTPIDDTMAPPPPATMDRFAQTFRKHGLTPRVVPQLHKLAGWK